MEQPGEGKSGSPEVRKSERPEVRKRIQVGKNGSKEVE